MFDVRPDNDLPGFRVRPFAIGPHDDVPGFRVKATEDVPGFRVPDDGLPRPDFLTGRLPSQGYVNVNSPYPYFPVGGSAHPDATLWDKIRDPDWIMPRATAAIDGAISIVPGTWNAIRAIGRAAGIAGKAEAKRFDDEMEFIGGVLAQAAKHPEPVARAAREVASELAKDPLLPYYGGGRFLAGSLLRVGPIPLGPIAFIGDALRAAEKGHNNVPDFIRRSILGTSWLGR
jgi:hypothetical protein